MAKTFKEWLSLREAETRLDTDDTQIAPARMQVQDAARRLGLNLTQMVQMLKRMFPQHADKITPNTPMQQPVFDKIAREMGVSSYKMSQSQGPANDAWLG